MNNKLVYSVSAYVWNPRYEDGKLIDNGYDIKTFYETEDKLKAEEYFNQMEVTDNIPQIMLEVDGGDWSDRLWVKDSTRLY